MMFCIDNVFKSQKSLYRYSLVLILHSFYICQGVLGEKYKSFIEKICRPSGNLPLSGTEDAKKEPLQTLKK